MERKNEFMVCRPPEEEINAENVFFALTHSLIPISTTRQSENEHEMSLLS